MSLTNQFGGTQIHTQLCLIPKHLLFVTEEILLQGLGKLLLHSSAKH